MVRKKQETKPKSESVNCLKCGKLQARTSQNYYKSPDGMFAFNDNYYPICKICISSFVEPEDGGYDYKMEQVYDILQKMNRVFLPTVWESAKEESVSRRERGTTGWSQFNCYMKTSVMQQYEGLTWKNSNLLNNEEVIAKKHEVKKNSKEDANKSTYVEEDYKITPTINKNGEDVLKMLGYDPFETENQKDKQYLYSRLVDFLDESTLEDSFKLPAVIEIVKAFSQIDKINSALSMITSDAKTISNNVGGIRSLIDAKEKMLKSVLALAKDNGISVNHNNNKSKGGGTLSGIIKQLQEKGFEEAEVSLFDVETCEGMKQVADVSNESIMKQLQFDENDYTFMISEQREIISELDEKAMKLEEENRVLKKELLSVKSGGMNEQ